MDGFVYFLILLSLLKSIDAASNSSSRTPRLVDIPANEIQYTELHPEEVVQFRLTDLLSNTSHIVFQVHSWQERLSVSLNAAFQPYSSVVWGRDLGVVTLITPQQSSADWFVAANASQSALRFFVMVHAELYSLKSPVPGGCNMEFPLEIDPNLHLVFQDAMNRVQFQYSGFRESMAQTDTCSWGEKKQLSYTVYQRFVDGNNNNSYFSTLAQMITPTGLKNNARKVVDVTSDDRSEVRLAGFTGHGVVYSVLVRDNSSHLAAYVPVVSYSCNDNQRSCTNLNAGNGFALISVVCFSLLGLFLCFLGHRFFKTEMFLFGLLAVTLLVFILVQGVTELSVSASVAVALVCGVCGGVIWWGVWFFQGIPVLSVLAPGLVMGYLSASLLFNATPFGGLTWWQSAVNYGLGFSAAVLILPVVLLVFTRILNILSCTIVGGYLAVVTIDVFVRGNLSQIIMLSLHKATVPGFLQAKVILPYQWSDLVLALVWFLLTLAGSVFQFLRERHRAPFPPCPWHLRKRQQYNSQQNTQQGSDEEDDDERGTDGQQDRRPLLAPE